MRSSPSGSRPSACASASAGTSSSPSGPASARTAAAIATSARSGSPAAGSGRAVAMTVHVFFTAAARAPHTRLLPIPMGPTTSTTAGAPRVDRGEQRTRQMLQDRLAAEQGA